ncbi:MAG TPA: hypothetical protein DIW17_06335 [Clostridiales bacterium]|jgi:hypothetical protein|uniref:hypothetical protein n=1 Tax=Proteiniphilum sp. UBA5510 TaxID=1947286 RepID=UPI000E9DBDC1|nr:hypothetical protein [Proteiniphilum sp. UBA5510]HAX51156.1 hypothetical protein [Lachnospiraceae bacterium]HCS73474.1 hypothetical protein [Clostridiales bacterium]
MRNLNLLYKTETTKTPEAISTPLLPNKKMPREVIDRVVRLGISNRHNCGLFDYVWIIAHAHTYCLLQNGKRMPKHAYLKTTFHELEAAFGVKNRKQCIEALDVLSQKGLIQYLVCCNSIYVYALLYKCLWTYSKKTTSIETGTINKSRGFIFLNIFSIRKYFSNTGRFSERDILISIWMNLIYNYQGYRITKDSAFMALYNGLRCSPKLKLKTLAYKWQCTPITTNKMLMDLDKNKFIKVIKLHSIGTFIAVGNYSELLFKKKSINVTEDYILVEFFHQDPDPKVREVKREEARKAAIKRYLKEKDLRENWLVYYWESKSTNPVIRKQALMRLRSTA